MLALDMQYHISKNGAIGTRLINKQQVMIMGNYDYATEATISKNVSEYGIDYDVPEPIDQWAVEDFEQFASLIVDAD